MPTPLILSYAKRSRQPVWKVEDAWDKAKKDAQGIRRSTIIDKDYWKLVNGLVKKALGLSESVSFKEFMLESDGDGEIKDKNGVAYNVSHETRVDTDGNTRHMYTIIPKGAPRGVSAGGVELTRDAKSVMSLGIHGEYQRKGLATALYNHIEKHLGYKLKPNTAQTEDGKEFWKSRKTN